jgi:DNA-binding MarR family transcriptional regulator
MTSGAVVATTVDADLVTALRSAVLILGRRMRYQSAGDLSQSELATLGRVSREGPITPGQLARSEHVQPPSMTRLLERLESKGFIERTPHPDDRRQVLISMTDAGREYSRRIREARAAWLSAHLERLDEADRDAIAAAADALVRLAELP